MFGLTRREQRWKAEQKAAETLLGFAAQVITATADADEIKRLKAELESAHEARRQAQAESAFLKERMARARIELQREMQEQGWVPPNAKFTAAPEAQPEGVQCNAGLGPA